MKLSKFYSELCAKNLSLEYDILSWKWYRWKEQERKFQGVKAFTMLFVGTTWAIVNVDDGALEHKTRMFPFCTTHRPIKQISWHYEPSTCSEQVMSLFQKKILFLRQAYFWSYIIKNQVVLIFRWKFTTDTYELLALFDNICQCSISTRNLK